jgi:hypothetical protein
MGAVKHPKPNFQAAARVSTCRQKRTRCLLGIVVRYFAEMAGGYEHWESVYQSKAADGLSWFEPAPSMSLRLILAAVPAEGAAVDVGAGASLLVDHLLVAGFDQVTLVDVSTSALSQVAVRIGPDEARVSLVCADVLSWRPSTRFNVWHDRAVFHFLTDAVDVERYVALAAAAVAPRGALVLGTFAADGPTSCSGLPTTRYAPDSLAALFANDFELHATEREEHHTPDGRLQPFTWVTLRRRS